MNKNSSKIFESVKFQRRRNSKKESELISDSDKSDLSESDKSEVIESKIVKINRRTSTDVSHSLSASPVPKKESKNNIDIGENIVECDDDYIEDETEDLEYDIRFKKINDLDYDLQLNSNPDHLKKCDSSKKKKNFFEQLKKNIKEEEEAIDIEKVISQCCEEKDEVHLFLDSVMKTNYNQYFLNVIKMDLLNHIEFLYMSKNDLNFINKSIFSLRQIIELDLSSNKLKKIPEDIGNLKNLIKLNLSHNNLADLPYNFEILTKLENLNLDFNDFRQIPPVVFKMKKLKYLYMANNSEITSFPPKKLFDSFEEISISLDNIPELVNEMKLMALSPNIKFEWNKIYPDKVLDSLFLGDIKSTFNRYVFDYYNIENVFSIGRELEVENFNGINYERYDIDDDEYQNIDFIILDKIHNKILNNKKCLVHCQKGISRSTTIVLAYLMKYKNMRLYDAYVFVKDKRDKIDPNDGFWKQLKKYDVKLFGEETRNFDEIRRD
jgi:hypothetical protein